MIDHCGYRVNKRFGKILRLLDDAGRIGSGILHERPRNYAWSTVMKQLKIPELPKSRIQLDTTKVVEYQGSYAKSTPGLEQQWMDSDH